MQRFLKLTVYFIALASISIAGANHLQQPRTGKVYTLTAKQIDTNKTLMVAGNIINTSDKTIKMFTYEGGDLIIAPYTIPPSGSATYRLVLGNTHMMDGQVYEAQDVPKYFMLYFEFINDDGVMKMYCGHCTMQGNNMIIGSGT